MLKSQNARSLLLGEVSALVLMALPGVAVAQSTSAGDSDQVAKEIVVTGNRRATVISKAPYNITAYDSTQLDASGISTVTALAQQVPNLTIQDTGARSSQSSLPIIRGINASLASGIFEGARNAQAPVGFYLDNAPLNASVPLMDIERIEVLRGPQGTLYGAGTLAGAVRIVTARPKLGEFSGNLGVGVTDVAHSGKYGYDLTGTLNIPAGDTAAIRITLKRERNAGFINQNDIIQREGNNYLNGLPVLAQPGNIAGSPAVYFNKKDVNYDVTTAGRIALLWEPTDAFKFSASYNYSEVKGNGAAVDNYTYPGGPSPIDARRTLAATGEYEISSSSLEPFERKTHQAALDASYDLGFATVSGSLAYGDTKGRNSIDANRHILGIPFFQDYYAGVPTNPRFVYGYQNTDSDTQWTEELRLVSNGKDNKVDYVLGVYFQQQDRTLGLFSYNPGGGDFLTNTPYYTGVPIFVNRDQSFLNQVATQKYKEAAIYGNVTVHLTDAWQVTGGGRFFRETFDATTDQRRGPFQAIDPVASASRNKASSQIFSVNTSYELAGNLTTYATWSQGFRRGGTSAFLIDPAVPFAESPNLLTYRPDKTNNFELGLKGKLGGIYFSAAGFYIKWNNAQIDLLTPFFGYSAVVNATRASSKGLELEASGPIGSSGLSFNLGFAYSKARIDKAFALRAAVGQDPLTGISIFADNGITGLKGDRLPGSPDYSGTFTLKYERDLSEKTKLGFNLGADFRGSTVNDLTPSNGFTLTAKTPSFITFRAGANVDFDAFSVSLFVNNLLDKHVVYSKGISNLIQQGLGGYGDTYYVGRPREIGLRLGYRF